MDFGQIYHFLFETMPGIGILIGACLILSVLVCVILERRTRRMYKDRPADDDEWALFEDEEDSP